VSQFKCTCMCACVCRDHINSQQTCEAGLERASTSALLTYATRESEELFFSSVTNRPRSPGRNQKSPGRNPTRELCAWVSHTYLCPSSRTYYYALTHTHAYTHTPSHTSHILATRSSWTLLLKNVRLTHSTTKNSQCICLV